MPFGPKSSSTSQTPLPVTGLESRQPSTIAPTPLIYREEEGEMIMPFEDSIEPLDGYCRTSCFGSPKTSQRPDSLRSLTSIFTGW